MSAAERYTMTVIGGAGYLALGVISVVLGYFLIQVALTYQPSRAGSWRDALGFLGSLDHGRWLLGAVAGGIVCYGLYFLLLVRYRQALG
jgi:hypothetical protein